jgi:peptide/nickel transport system permease protein
LRGCSAWQPWPGVPHQDCLRPGQATVIYTISGVFLGILSARHHGRGADRCILVPVLLSGAWPPFFLGMLLIILLSARLGLFPMGEATGLAARGPPLPARVLDAFLPCLALVLAHLSGAYLLVRSSMLGVLGLALLGLDAWSDPRRSG